MSAVQHLPAFLSSVLRTLHSGLTRFVLFDSGQHEVESSSDIEANVNNYAQQQHMAVQPTAASGFLASTEAFLQCTELCTEWSAEETAQRIASLHSTLPLLPFSMQDSLLLR